MIQFPCLLAAPHDSHVPIKLIKRLLTAPKVEMIDSGCIGILRGKAFAKLSFRPHDRPLIRVSFETLLWLDTAGGELSLSRQSWFVSNDY